MLMTAVILGSNSIWSDLLAIFVVLPGLAALVAIGIRAADSIAKERQQGTLDSLLSLPLARRDIIAAKASAAFRVGLIPAAIAVVVGLLGVARGSFEFAAAIGVPVAIAGWMSAAIGFGLWLSTRCATRERAICWFLGVGLTTALIPPMVGALIDNLGTDPLAIWSASQLDGLSPAMGLWNAIPRTQDSNRTLESFSFEGAVLGAVVVGLVGWLLMGQASRRFERRE